MTDNGARRIYRYDTERRKGENVLGDLLFEGIGSVHKTHIEGGLSPDQAAMKDLFDRRGGEIPSGTYFVMSDDLNDLGGPFYVSKQELTLA